MEPYQLPRVAAYDYGAFRALMDDHVQPTHAEFTEFMAQRFREESRRQSVVYVDVHPDEFARYVGPTGQYDHGSLTRFIGEKFHGRRY